MHLFATGGGGYLLHSGEVVDESNLIDFRKLVEKAVTNTTQNLVVDMSKCKYMCGSAMVLLVRASNDLKVKSVRTIMIDGDFSHRIFRRLNYDQYFVYEEHHVKGVWFNEAQESLAESA